MSTKIKQTRTSIAKKARKLKPAVAPQASLPRNGRNQTIREVASSINFDRPAESAGEELGKRLGRYAGALLGRLTGTGDYDATLPSGGMIVESTVVPEFIKSDNSRETRIRHREYLGDVLASSTAGAFKNTPYPLNPGNASTFPWLATIAQQYEQWRPNGIVIIFKSLSSTYAASQSLGTIVLSTDYDVYDAAYASKIEMENAEFAVSGNAAQCLMHPVECNSQERFTNLLQIRSSTTIPTYDNLRFYDLGNLQVASQGCLANQLLGELWITYDISLFKPQIGLPLAFPWSAYTSNAFDVDDAFGNVGIVVFSTRNSLNIVPTAKNVLTFGPGAAGRYYRIEQWIPTNGTSTGGLSPLQLNTGQDAYIVYGALANGAKDSFPFTLPAQTAGGVSGSAYTSTVLFFKGPTSYGSTQDVSFVNRAVIPTGITGVPFKVKTVITVVPESFGAMT